MVGGGRSKTDHVGFLAENPPGSIFCRILTKLDRPAGICSGTLRVETRPGLEAGISVAAVFQGADASSTACRLATEQVFERCARGSCRLAQTLSLSGQHTPSPSAAYSLERLIPHVSGRWPNWQAHPMLITINYCASTVSPSALKLAGRYSCSADFSHPLTRILSPFALKDRPNLHCRGTGDQSYGWRRRRFDR